MIEKRAAIVSAGMRRLCAKLLTILLTLLLGFSPLQGVAAGCAVSALDQAGSAYQMADGADDSLSLDQAASRDCDSACIQAGCGGTGCFSGVCAFCAPALPPMFLQPANFTATPGFPLADAGVANRHATSLFRPPRG